MTSDLWDDLAEDDRYNTLPGSARPYATERGISTADVVRKESILSLTEELAEARNAFHDYVISKTDQAKRHYIDELAMRSIDVLTVKKILFPFPLGEDLTVEQIDEYEEMVRQALIEKHPEWKDRDGVLPVRFCDLEEYDEFTAVPNDYFYEESLSKHREQALLFIKEYVRRKRLTE